MTSKIFKSVIKIKKVKISEHTSLICKIDKKPIIYYAKFQINMLNILQKTEIEITF